VKSIYTYDNYREYLRDFLSWKREKNPRYSTRCAAVRCGVPSGTFTRILNGTRNIGPSLLPKYVEFLGLKKREAGYFAALVRFSHVSDEKEKRACYEELVSMRAMRKHLVPDKEYRFFEQWYHVALHELLRIMPRATDCETLGPMLIPAISGAKVRKSIELLKRLGYVTVTERGEYAPVEPFLTTGDVWKGVAVRAFQVMMAGLGSEALDRFPKEERDISTLTMAFSNEAFGKVREVIKEARERIAQIERDDTNAKRVYQMNFQLFPLSKPSSEESGT
jgi:uncharacterized protein (TIGR02147 family)